MVPSIVTRNVVFVNFNGGSAITISGDTSPGYNQSTSISSVVINAVPNPSYQWQDSTQFHSWQDIAGASGIYINYTPSMTGDKLRCKLNGTSLCGTNLITSNVLRFTLGTVIVGRELNILYYPNPASTILTIDSLNLLDNWETLSITGARSENAVGYRSMVSQKRVYVSVQHLASGMYIITLRRREGVPAFYKFIKL